MIFGLSKGRYFTASYENVAFFSSSVEWAILGVLASIEVETSPPESGKGNVNLFI